MLKDIVEALKVMGLEVPKWIGLLMLITAIVVGVYILVVKKFIPWVKRVLKLHDDILSISEIKKNTNSIMNEIKGISDNINTLTEGMAKMQEEIVRNSISQSIQCDALKMMLCNELDKKYRRYLEIGSIPNEEFDEYVHMFESYANLGGNGSGKQKYDYIMEHLERKV